jgi:hypothetical protein
MGGIGLLAVIVLTVFEGIKYRIREDQGLHPIYAPDWVVASTNVGLALFGLALVGLMVVGVIAFVRSRLRRRGPVSNR